MSFEFLHSVTQFMGRLSQILHKTFASRFIPEFKEALFSYLRESPVALMRDFHREKMDHIRSCLERLLKRYLTIE